MNFPKVLDGAEVLYFTSQSSFGPVYYSTGGIADHICYLAICKYKNGDAFYLFGCNSDYEVVSDSPWGSIKECMRIAKDSYNCEIAWIAMT